ncbi:5-formyltetrahydrofolate cyclo-ligase [Massilia sp. R2A-15]|uniref:5-formyltetrahydrofolate cyclo-ligase n=1 Tax=Massilia sp. R2A-15 TaxID=3064278 RepID=UPI0027353B93|nr:5-formyltetrahydrofolate cyclo-ligase [Massilia sp. R2A-15]WLI89298.1 5-formyltetrahydrofolate cyclo-ligase [Massilia sp. R2A-15]
MTGQTRIPCAPTELPASAASDAQSAKAALRRSLAAARAAIGPEQKRAWDAAIGEHLLDWWRTHRLPALAVYWPLRNEADLSLAYAELAQNGVRLALPVVLARDAALGFADWLPGEAMHKDEMGIAVPEDLRMVDRPPAMLVPCLGFNTEGYRLGYGGGFYDRTLEATPRPLTLGIAYSCLAAEFPSAPHDVALDRVITELG